MPLPAVKFALPFAAPRRRSSRSEAQPRKLCTTNSITLLLHPGPVGLAPPFARFKQFRRPFPLDLNDCLKLLTYNPVEFYPSTSGAGHAIRPKLLLLRAVTAIAGAISRRRRLGQFIYGPAGSKYLKIPVQETTSKDCRAHASQKSRGFLCTCVGSLSSLCTIQPSGPS